MGGSSSQEKKPPSLLDMPKKEGDITVKPIGELQKIDTGNFNLPKPAAIKSKSQLAQEALEQERKSLIPFSLKKQYELETYLGRF